MNDQNNLNNQGNNNFTSPLQPPSQTPQEPVNQQPTFIQNPAVDNNPSLVAAPVQNPVQPEVVQPQVMPQPSVQPQVMPPLVEQQPMDQNMNGYNQYPQNNYDPQAQNYGGYQEPVNQPAPKKSKAKLIIILVIVLVVLPIIAFVVMSLFATQSVTGYINSSRKSAYSDTALQYLKASHIFVEYEKVPAPDDDTLLLIPGGHDSDRSMIALESGGASPYNSTYLYVYVLVEKVGEEEVYHFVASDASMQGIAFATEKELQGRNATDYVRAGMSGNSTGIGACHNLLKDKYSNSEVEKGNISDLKECTDKMNLQNKSIKKYVICSNKGCE